MPRPTDIRPTTMASPEGRPAQPERSPHAIVVRIFLCIAVVVAAAFTLGLFFGLPGAVIGVLLVTALAVVFNPEMWTAKKRVQDVDESESAGGGADGGPATTAARRTTPDTPAGG